jgi:hypothetical protein
MAQSRFASIRPITMFVKQAYSGKRQGQNIFRATIFFDTYASVWSGA